MRYEKIFVSYSRTDSSEFALRLVKDLREARAKIWLDQTDIKPGQTWDVEIQNALLPADCVIFIVSENSVASANVLDEVRFAIDKKKKVIPVMFRSCEKPFWLNRLQHIDFLANYEAGLEILKKELDLENINAGFGHNERTDDAPTDESSELFALVDKGYKLVNQKNQQAPEVLDRAIFLARRQADIWFCAFSIITKANYYITVLNDTARALTLSNEARRLINDTDTSLLGHYEACLGMLYHQEGDIHLAEKHYLAAIKYLESVANKNKFDMEKLPAIYYNSYILFLYTRSDDIFGNVKHLNHALGLYRKTDNKRGMMLCYNAFANLYFTREEPIEKSVEMALKSCALENEVGDPSLAAISCSLAGLFLAKANRFEESLVYFDKADSHLSLIENPLYKGMLLHNKGQAFLDMKQYGEAVIFLKGAEKIYTGLNNKIELVKIWELLGDAYKGMDDYKHAYEYENQFRNSILAKAADDILIRKAKNKL